MIYIGKLDDEFYFFDIKDEFKGWSLNGCYMKTEEELREEKAQIEITDLYDVPASIERWIDHEQFKKDMEEDWFYGSDINSEFELDDETYYLVNSSGEAIYDFFKKNYITNYDKYIEYFEDAALTRQKFEELIKLMTLYSLDEDADFKKELIKWSKGCKEFPDKMN